MRTRAGHDDAFHLPSAELYSWTQTSEQITIFMPIRALIKGRDIIYKLTPTTLILGIKGEQPVIDGLMFNAVKPDDSWWEIDTVDGKRFVKAVIQKVAEHEQWKVLFKCLKLCNYCGERAPRMSKCRLCSQRFNLKWLET